ncbi:MAG: pyridoxal-phosphate dependent enzyme [Deltaproteobacteria bacterium]|nr:pyridoxal-phosphate dependent enzyme [Deltaproteobacteria bacterium]
MMIYGPTFEEMLHPDKIEPTLRRKAREALDKEPLSPLNLYNISWKGADDRVRHLVLPRELTGIDAEIVVLLGRFFPTGSHKVGATYSCCIERQVRGQVQPGKHRLVWPSTGNYGIGGAYVGPRMGYDSLVILPEEMSQERFDKIAWYGAKYVKTPGCESNVKEIYDKTHELEREANTIIVNQFAEFGNYRFHWHVTGNSILALFDELRGKGLGTRLAGFTSAMGSSGTIAAGDRLRQVHPDVRVVGLEPTQCPTLYSNGFGGHDIQGIGDKHVTWIHNTDNMDAMACLDEWDCKKGLQVLAEEPGRRALAKRGVKAELLESMAPSFGISGICNVLGAIKTAKRYRMGRGDILFTIATDGLDRYPSVLAAMTKQLGAMDEAEAERRIESIFHKQADDWTLEATQHAKDCWANLKYYTWVEQQGKTVAELRRQRSREYWLEHQALVPETDRMIREQRGKA